MALIYKDFLNGLNLNGNVYSLSTNYWMFDKTKISLIYSFFAYLCIICFCLANRRPPCLLIILCWCSSLFPCWICELLRSTTSRLTIMSRGRCRWRSPYKPYNTSTLLSRFCIAPTGWSSMGILTFAYCTFKAINL